MIKQLTIYPAKIFAGILAGFLSVFVENLLPLFITVTVFERHLPKRKFSLSILNM